ncbi:MAG: grasp-with-spasm system SPASM domain peptide maturase [Bacteroidota bacterium]|nr:grasp-with-spasm system SPASM domain peptide maturase [Bacteroidota bacterium]
MDGYFNLYSFCHPVKGCKRAVVCDLLRNIIQPIPLVLYDFLEKGQGKSAIDQQKLTSEEKNAIDTYISFLYHHEFGYITQLPIPDNPDNSYPEFQEKDTITNAIIDFSSDSTHSLEQIVPQLEDLGCKALEIRYYYQLPFRAFEHALKITTASSLEKVECYIEASDEFSLDKLISLKNSHPKLSKITLSNASDNVIYKHNDLIVINTTEQIRNETKCGVSGELYCIADSQLFWESKHFNNCLYKKIAIDKDGYIRNCPSMKECFGHITNTPLCSVIEKPSFKKYWNITKDEIDDCSVCELRYVCQDCRAYTIETSNPYSKPLKCRYNPKE